MFSFLSPDSKFTAVLNRISDLVILNVLFLLTCLPVFTIGTSCAAMYTLCFRMVRNGESHIVRSYFRAFGENFRQGTALWLLYLFVSVPNALYLDTFFRMEGVMRYLFAICLLFLILTLFMAAYAFPWISQFHNRIPEVLRNSLILSVTHVPGTVFLCALNLLPWILLAVLPEFFLRLGFLFLALYFSSAAYLNATLLWKVFKPYYPEEITASQP